MWYIQVYERQFAQEQMERFGLQEKKALTEKRRELDKAKLRVAEIDRIIQKSYEDMAKGLLSEERFVTLSMAYKSEQRELKTQIPELETTLNSTTSKADDLQKFIDRAKWVTRLTELTPEIVHEFIEKIVVSKPEKVDGKRRIFTTTLSDCGMPRSRRKWSGFSKNTLPRNGQKGQRSQNHAV